MLNEIKNSLKGSNFTKDIYSKIREIYLRNNIKVYETNQYHIVKTELLNYRLNLVVPNFTQFSVFGGITTALKVFQAIADQLGFDKRILVIGSEHYSKYTYNAPEFTHNAKKNGLFFLSENPEIKIGEKDIFVFTSWMTAYLFFPIFRQQKQMFELKNRKIIYLIQDFEPGFYPWSTEYLLAETTYRNHDETIAVFNSQELYHYFKQHGYSYSSEFAFRPCLNDSLKKELLAARPVKKRKKIIIIYGRPVAARNTFSLIYTVLKLWSHEYKDARNWKIYSLGDKFSDIRLENNTIQFLGKLSLQEYAQIMLHASVGISMMVSPHPSYPPLEMSTFGVKTITNSFGTKDLSGFNNNIVSIDNCSPDLMVKKLKEICDQYGKITQQPVLQGDYIDGNDFSQVMEQVATAVKNMLHLA